MKINHKGTIYVHLGLHKTGTTSLQVHVFPNLNSIHYVGRFHKAGQYGENIYLDIMNYCCSPNEQPALKNNIVTGLTTLLNHNDILISDEWLTSNYDGFYFGKGSPWTTKLQRLESLLKYFNSKFLLCTRSVVDGAFSMYCEYKQISYGANYTNFKEFCASSFDALAYVSCEPYVAEILGKSKTEIIRHEELRDNPVAFKHLLQNFFGSRDIKDIGFENQKPSDNKYVEINSKGIFFDKLKLYVRNSNTVSKLLFNNIIGRSAIKAATKLLGRRNSIPKPSHEQSVDCYELLISRDFMNTDNKTNRR